MNKTPLDNILAVVLMIGLGWASYVLLKKRGPMKWVGGGILMILIINLLNTSNYWLGGMQWLISKENQLATGLEGWKNDSRVKSA